jgi:hypothetical protein
MKRTTIRFLLAVAAIILCGWLTTPTCPDLCKVHWPMSPELMRLL